MTSGANLARCAMSLIGVPFLHRGRTRAGLDCAGLVWLARKMAWGATDDERCYPTRPTSDFVLSRIGRRGTRIGLMETGPGDVVVLRLGRSATHLGVLTAEGVVHALPGVGVVETSRSLLAADHRIRAAFRLAGGR